MSQVKFLKINSSGLPAEMDQANDELKLKSFTAEQGDSKTEISAGQIALMGMGGVPVLPTQDNQVAVKKYVDDEVSAEELARQSADQLLQSNIDAEVLARQTGDTNTLNAAKAYADSVVAGSTIEIAQVKFVSKNGSDTTGTGSLNKPYASITAALNSITDASPSKRYEIKLQPGTYTETAVALKANVFIVGDSQDLVTIVGPISMHSSFSGSADNRSGLSNVRVNSAVDFDWSTVTSAAGKIYLQECVFVSTVRMYGHNNAIAQAQMQACEFFGAVTISGINVGIANDNRHYAAINLQQHPNGGMATILSMHGGAIQAKLTATTTVNDFNRRCSIFAFGTYIDELEVNGAASYADLSEASVPRYKERLTNPNNGNIVYLNSNIPYKTNDRNFGDLGRQYLYNFSYVHASTESDLYLISMGSQYGADSAGRSIYIESDSYGLNPNVNGGDINITTAEVSGTGVRGKIKLTGREVDVSSAKMINVADGVNAKDAVNKSQLDAASTGLQSQITTEKGRIDAILSASSADKDTFAEIVSLINSVDLTNDNALASAVLGLQASIDAEVAARQAGDSSEASARQAADSALQSSIDSVLSSLNAEISNRQSGDSALQTSLNSEISARQSADTVLQGSISSEASTRAAEDLTFLKLNGSRKMVGDLEFDYVPEVIASGVVTARYIKFAATWGYSSKTNPVTEPYLSVKELKIRESGNYVSLTGSSITAFKPLAYPQNGGPLEAIIDGKLVQTSGPWFMNMTANLEDVFQIDMGTPRSFDSVQIFPLNVNSVPYFMPKTFKIYVSNDGSTWNEVLSVVDYDSQSYDTENGVEEVSPGNNVGGFKPVGEEFAVSGGSSVATPAEYYQIKGIADGTDPRDAVNKQQLDGLSSSLSGLLSSEELARIAGDNALDARLDILEGSGEGSVLKAKNDAKAYADSLIATEAATRASEDLTFFKKDGSRTMTGAMNMGGFKIQNMLDPASAQDAATKKYVDDSISGLVNGAGAALDTLKELADALGNDANFSATIAGQIGSLDSRLDVLEGTGTGSLYQTLVDAKAYTDQQVQAGKEYLVAFVAGEAINKNQMVSVNSMGQVVVGDISSGSLARVIGSAESTVLSGQTVYVRLVGKVSGLSGIVAGQRYFLDSNGGISASAPAGVGQYIIQVGFGVSSTEVILALQNMGVRS